jgi:tRNA nucleotidyltransferase (CCA-adding enzyme)
VVRLRAPREPGRVARDDLVALTAAAVGFRAPAAMVENVRVSDFAVHPAIERLCRAVGAVGGRGYVVGGWVRDRLRGVESAEYDLEVFGVEAPALKTLLARAGSLNAVGEAFTVYKLRLADAAELPTVDVSLPRRESKSGRGHRGFTVTGDPHLPVEEAARRRDFTVNAMLYEPLAGELVDPFGGVADLERHLLRAVDPTTFGDDSLRVLRAVQFAARFELEVEPRTVALCRAIDLADLPPERIWGEVEKWLDRARRPSIGWWAARELGVVRRLWPEVAALVDCEQEPEWHPEGDVFTHTGLVLDEARPLADELPYPRRMTLLLAAIAHDFGKPATTRIEDERIRSRGHEEAGVEPAARFLERLNVRSLAGYDVRGQVLALVQYHLAPTHFWNAERRGQLVSAGAFRRLAMKVEPDLLRRLALADTRGRATAPPSPAPEWLYARQRELEVADAAPRPLLLGRHVLALGVAPGPRVGEIVRAVFERQLDGEVTTLDQAIEQARELVESADR